MKFTWLVSLALIAGCSKTNANYCANAPDHNCAEQTDAQQTGSDGPMGCQQQSDCTSSDLPVCDTGSHLCVACDSTHLTACPSATPICDTTGETCRTCVTHSECGSPGACLPDGTCGSDTNVAYVSTTGTDSGTCTALTPCATLGYALMQTKAYIKVGGGMFSEHITIDKDVTILAEAGAKLVAGGNTAITITGARTVSISDLRITGSATGILVGATDNATLTLTHVIVDDNTGAGLNMGSGSVTMSRCVFSVNYGGGAIISATYNITNSIFVANGSGGSTTGGLTLTPPTTSSVFRFNTVSDNVAGSTAQLVEGINCTIPSTALTNNIINNNPTSSNCTHDYSLFNTGTATAHNKIGAPAFKNMSTGDPTAGDFYRIGSTSAAIDSGDPASTLAKDIDGHMRPDGTTFDIGASEY